MTILLKMVKSCLNLGMKDVSILLAKSALSREYSWDVLSEVCGSVTSPWLDWRTGMERS